MSSRRVALVLLLLAIAGCGRDRGSAGTRDNPLALMLSPEHASPELARRLEAELMRHAELTIAVRVARDPDAAVAEAGTVATDCAILPVFEYLLARQEFGVEATAQVVRAGDARSYRGVLLVRQDAPLQAVRDLDGSRDRFLEPRRAYPVVTFLLRDGAGAHELPFAPSLVGWARGSDVDPDQLAEVDPAKGRKKFEEETGGSPEAWLARFERGEVPTDARSLTLNQFARLLVPR